MTVKANRFVANVTRKSHAVICSHTVFCRRRTDTQADIDEYCLRRHTSQSKKAICPSTSNTDTSDSAVSDRTLFETSARDYRR
jgi:hypothetical protein